MADDAAHTCILASGLQPPGPCPGCQAFVERHGFPPGRKPALLVAAEQLWAALSYKQHAFEIEHITVERLRERLANSDRALVAAGDAVEMLTKEVRRQTEIAERANEALRAAREGITDA